MGHVFKQKLIDLYQEVDEVFKLNKGVEVMTYNGKPLFILTFILNFILLGLSNLWAKVDSIFTKLILTVKDGSIFQKIS